MGPTDIYFCLLTFLKGGGEPGLLGIRLSTPGHRVGH